MHVMKSNSSSAFYIGYHEKAYSSIFATRRNKNCHRIRVGRAEGNAFEITQQEVHHQVGLGETRAA